MSFQLVRSVGIICCVNLCITKSIPSEAYHAEAEVSLVATDGNSISGLLILRKTVGGVQITGTIFGLQPGPHGFHVHANGDTGNNCKAAGGHFNPEMVAHASPNSAIRHVGDLGNIVARQEDTVFGTKIDIVDNVLSLGDGGEHDVSGLAIVVHAGEDDLGLGVGDQADGSKASGNAGPRVACGIIMQII